MIIGCTVCHQLAYHMPVDGIIELAFWQFFGEITLGILAVLEVLCIHAYDASNR
jgi:hypothetical protein